MTTRWMQVALLALASAMAIAAPVAFAQDTVSMRARHEALRERLASNSFHRPLVLESTQASGDLKGDAYAVVEQPFSAVGPALKDIEHWCDVLMLHLNVKHCSSAGKAPGEVLSLAVGRKFDQPLADAYRVQFAYAVQASTADYLRVQMAAAEGPMGTRDYRLTFEAVPLGDKRSFIHMSYAYGYGTAARIAMQAYLATAGRDKVGFSVTGKSEDGQPVYIDGVRGVVERNTMRYFLAIETYLAGLLVPAAEQAEKRINDWYAATERHPLQLHEMTRDDYLAMKRSELRRQSAGASAPR
jgi:hypothetical protein